MASLISAKKYRSMEQTLRYIPEELKTLCIWCDQCKQNVHPPWLEKRPPLEVEFDKIGQQYIPVSTNFTCPVCTGSVLIPVPVVKQTGGYVFFGDEAFRETDELWGTTFSLVGTLNRDLKILEDKVQQLKQKIEPTLSPNEWKIHMKDIWSGDVRKSNPQFESWDKKRVDSLCNSLIDLIKNYGQTLQVLNVSSIFNLPENRKDLKRLKDSVRNQVYLSLIYQTIDLATKHGVRPKFQFDGDTKRPDGTYTQPWASDVFIGGKLNLVYPFLARGMNIDVPEVVEPGSHAGLELADFISFVIARYLHRKLKGEAIDINPNRLGKIRYIGFTSEGDMLCRLKDRYPWGDFFGNF